MVQDEQLIDFRNFFRRARARRLPLGARVNLPTLNCAVRTELDGNSNNNGCTCSLIPAPGECLPINARPDGTRRYETRQDSRCKSPPQRTQWKVADDEDEQPPGRQAMSELLRFVLHFRECHLECWSLSRGVVASAPRSYPGALRA